MTLRSLIGRTASTLLMLGLAACGGGGGDSPSTFTIGGTVTGLASGTQIVMNNNGDPALTVSADGAFTFAKPVAENGSYLVTINTQPTGQTCSVANFQGAGVTANVTTVAVTCSPVTHTVGGSVTGLAAGQQVVLNNNGADPATVTADGAFTFAAPVPFNGSYAVTVGTQPTGQTCTVSNGSGSGVVANVSDVAVTCSTNTFTVGVTVAGLGAGKQVTLQNNASDPLTVVADGGTTFATPVTFNGSYAVTVGTQPTGQTCTVANGSGSGVVANITNVTVTCSTSTFTIGGTISGLAAGQQVTLNNNAGNALTRNANGAFTFTTPVTFNGAYAVTVATQPTGQTCTVASGSGSGVVANITNVTVTCTTNTFTIGGTISGLAAGQQVTLNNNGGNALTRNANGAFTFTTPVAFNGAYAVTVATQPTGQTCSVANGSGSGVVANITNVTVTCSTNTYTIGGTISGLAAGQQVTLNNNGGNALTRNANGAFVFTTPVTFNGAYAVTVATQPTGQTCSVANGSGSGVVANITNVTVTCSTNTYTIGGTISGLAAGQQVTLNNNGGNALTRNANGAFTFTTPVTFNGAYAVTVATQPTGQTCSVTNGSGSGVVANITNVTVTCSTNTFTIGGTISGLAGGQQVTLNNNGGDALTRNANGAFTFTTPVTFNSSYVVTVATQPTGQTCTVTNGSGSNVAANITNVTVTCSTNTFTIGGTVTGLAVGQQVTLNNNGANPKTVTVDGSFTFTTPVSFNGSYVVTVGTQPTNETCTVTNGSGTNVQANVSNVTVTCRLAIAYVANKGDNTVSEFTIGTDGTLTSIGTIGTGNIPNVVAVDPKGRFAYVANFGADPGGAQGTTVSQYIIGATGVLTANGTATTELNPYSIAVDPTGSYVYVTNQGSNSVSQFTINPDGTLAALGTPVATGSKPYQITVDPTGKYAYVADLATGTTTGGVSQYTITPGTGVLVPMSAPFVGTTAAPNTGGAIGVAVDPTGTYAYVTNLFDQTIVRYTITPGTGALVAVVETAQPTGVTPYPLAISPDGKFAFWSNKGDSDIAPCAIAAGGALACTNGLQQGTVDTQPQYAAVDPFSQHVYTVNYNAGGAGSVAQFSFDTTNGSAGTLTRLTPSSVATGLGAFSIAITR